LHSGGKSEADLNSETFDVSLLAPKPRPSKCKHIYFLFTSLTTLISIIAGICNLVGGEVLK